MVGECSLGTQWVQFKRIILAAQPDYHHFPASKFSMYSIQASSKCSSVTMLSSRLWFTCFELRNAVCVIQTIQWLLLTYVYRLLSIKQFCLQKTESTLCAPHKWMLSFLLVLGSKHLLSSYPNRIVPGRADICLELVCNSIQESSSWPKALYSPVATRGWMFHHPECL